ncbi:MAG: DUF904 domain-containing protein [Proteobacteria bacterium]|nr:DUF904 domain-containing protein [Pseudomonadota bacterium]MBU1708391.1 DUF904 domain-containing protein [Pseudomonadota bacterium]
MEHAEDINRLEAIVEKMIANYNILKQEKLSLEAVLGQKDKELKELRETVDSLKGEKSVIHKRVSGLIDSIEKWEKASSPSTAEPQRETGEKSQSQIFTIGGQQ